MNAATQKKSLVYGFGNTGLSVARFLAREGIDAAYYDSRQEPPGLDELGAIDESTDIRYGEDTGGLLDGVERVITSPGIPDSDELLADARERQLDVVSDIELFVDKVDAPFVAVTGSNGKSTVATLLALMCEAAGKRALAGANLGKPALDLLAGDTPDFYILELSSFQLQRTTNLPAAVGTLLNISADHLDWHVDEQEYVAAKYRIFREAEAVVFNRADATASEHFPADAPASSFGADEPGDGQFGIREDEGQLFLARAEQLLLATDDIAMVGRHNQQNALAALATGQFMGLPMPAMLQVLNEFPGLPHRMQFVDRINDAAYINDSKATNVGAAIASVEAIDGLVVLLAGGVGKGGDFDSLARAIHPKLRCAVVFGDDAAKIASAMNGLVPVHRVEDLPAAVRVAAVESQAGDTVLLAPACASFDQYPNYMRRGDDFCSAVRELRT